MNKWLNILQIICAVTVMAMAIISQNVSVVVFCIWIGLLILARLEIMVKEHDSADYKKEIHTLRQISTTLALENEELKKKINQ